MIEFTKILINLDERKDRLKESIQELNKVNIHNVIRFPAIKTTPGIFGCTLSHTYSLAIAKQENKHAMIFEDDIKFVGNFQEILDKSLQDLENKDWVLFYLGGNICNTITPETPNLGRLSHCQSTHAMCINKNYIDLIWNIIPQCYGVPLDLVYSNYVIPNYPCYITLPEMIAVQRKSFSDIEGVEVEYESWMGKRYSDNLTKYP